MYVAIRICLFILAWDSFPRTLEEFSGREELGGTVGLRTRSKVVGDATTTSIGFPTCLHCFIGSCLFGGYSGYAELLWETGKPFDGAFSIDLTLAYSEVFITSKLL